MRRRVARARVDSRVSYGRGGSPLRLRPFDDIVYDLLNCLPSALGLRTFVIIAFTAQTLSLKEHSSIGLLDDLDVDRELEPAPGSDCLRRIGADGNGNIGVVCANDAANDGIRSVFRCVAHAEPSLQLAPHGVEELTLNLGRGRLVVERQNGH